MEKGLIVLNKDSYEIRRFIETMEGISKMLDTNYLIYRPILDGNRYITEQELSKALKITKRTLIEYSEEKITKDDVVDIVTGTVGFMVKFLTICDRDSKDAITMFSGIMNEIYEKKTVVKDDVVMALASEYLNKGITA